MRKNTSTRLYMLIMFVFGTASFCTFAMAEDYPCKPEGDIESAWFRVENMDPTYLVFRRLEDGAQAFNIPYAYLFFRPTPERVNCYPDRFDFAFWMPTLAPSKKEAFYANGWTPEEGYPPGGSYLVRVPYVRTIPDGKDAPGFPFSSIEFIMDMYKERIPFKNELTRISALDFWSEIYVNLDQKQGDTRLDCFNIGCEFTFYFRDLKIAVQGSFAKDKLLQWKAIKAGTRTLLERWIVR